ncbi:MAG: Lipopolysaccharide heptosyltransferase 1 [Chlamydiales bacterium]|nr:Lipopolysaccharide heptosyltransferase 1 [Chlamydiales bacterium]MCH9623473.1 Lipopolysaccharide heptosyltransferase 1 [Chlamydiales bacterium]
MKFLIIKSSSYGDILHAFRAVSYLRHKSPYGQIDWVVENRCRELVESHPEVDAAVVIDSKRLKCPKLERYDVVFDLQGNLKSAWVLSKVRAKLKIGFGWKSLAEWPNFFFTHLRTNPPHGRNIRDDYLAVVQAYFKESVPFKEKPFLYPLSKKEKIFLQTIDPKGTVVCPFANWKSKQLPKKTVDEVLAKRRGPFYFIWGNEEERKRAHAFEVEEKKVLPHLSLPLLQRVMDRCRLVIAMDSLPLHLCATTKTPSLSFFGSSSMAKYAPQGEHHLAEQGICPYGVQFEKRCPKLRSCQSVACINKLRSR